MKTNDKTQDSNICDIEVFIALDKFKQMISEPSERMQSVRAH